MIFDKPGKSNIVVDALSRHGTCPLYSSLFRARWDFLNDIRNEYASSLVVQQQVQHITNSNPKDVWT